MNVNDLKKEQYRHIAEKGGYLNLSESDNVNNDLNRAIIKAYKVEHGTAYIGFLNLKENKREALKNEKCVDVLDEYLGETIYNFGADFIVSIKDELLESLIKEWNIKIKAEADLDLLDKIFNRIEEINGIHFVWS